jgi:hypothetical protein
MRAASGSRVLRRLISGRGLMVMALLVTVVGVLGIRGLQQLITERAERGAELSARLVTSLTVRRNLVLDAHGTPAFGSSAREDMTADVTEPDHATAGPAQPAEPNVSHRATSFA